MSSSFARACWAAGLLGLGALGLAVGWSGPVAIAVLGTAAIAPLALVAIGARLRVPVPVVTVGVLAIAAAAAHYLAIAPGGASTMDAVRDAVPRLLTAPRPAPATPELLLPGAALALLVGILVGLRTLSPGRRGSGLVAAPAGAAILYAAGALLTAGADDTYGLVAFAIVVLCAVGWLTLDPSRPPLRAFAGRLVPVVAVALVAALVGGSTLASAFEPRLLVDPPRRALSEPSPLPRLAAWHEQGDAELLQVRGQSGDRLRLVTLAGYTGVAWSASALYRPLGAVAAPTLAPGRQRSTLDADVTVAGLEGLWLPGVGDPLALGSQLPSNVDYEPDSGSLALREGELSRGLRYRVRGLLDTPPVEDVSAAGVPSGPAVRHYVDVPRLPWAFSEYARRATFGASTPFEQAVALEYAVREGRHLDAAAPVGSSYARLETFLFRSQGTEAGAQVGSSEQFAAAFAVLARAVGLPSRVVLGFTVGGPEVDGARVVRGRDALAWPEVYFTGLGWYPFDPTPSAGSAVGDRAKLMALDRMGEQAARAAQASATPLPPAIAPITPPPTSAVAAAPGFHTGPFATSTLAVLAAVAVLMLLLSASARAIRRRGHRRAGARGAWSEVVDLLVLLGRPPARFQPAPEIAAGLASIAPSDAPVHPATVIAVAADRAAFAPVSNSAQTQGWPALPALRRAVRAVVPLRRRLLWPFDPRPLLHQRRRRR